MADASVVKKLRDLTGAGVMDAKNALQEAGEDFDKAVEIIKEKGFGHYSVRDFLVEEIKKRELTVNRENMVMVGNDLRATHGAGYVVLELYKRAQAAGKNAVIESVRTVGEVETLRTLQIGRASCRERV